jgi:hypothetical protein
MILTRRIHHAFKRIDAAEPLCEFVAGKLLEAFRHLIADEQVVMLVTDHEPLAAAA